MNANIVIQQMCVFILLKVMANALSVTRMSDPAHWFVFVTNAIMGHTRAVVSYVEDPEYLMPTTVKSAPSRRKT